MSTLDQPLYCDGYCPKCERFFFAIHIGEEPRGLKHKCGQAMIPVWRRLVVSHAPVKCLTCQGDAYREVTAQGPDGMIFTDDKTSDGNSAASFVIHDGGLTRHMCGIPLMLNGEAMTTPLHPDVSMH